MLCIQYLCVIYIFNIFATHYIHHNLIYYYLFRSTDQYEMYLYRMDTFFKIGVL